MLSLVGNISGNISENAGMNYDRVTGAVTNNQQKSARPGVILFVLLLLVCFAFAVFLYRTVKLHFHLPVNGKKEYVSVISNQSCIDVFNFAQAHDRAGETELATYDFKEGVKCPDFKNLPPKIKSTMIELVDCRDSMDKHDYFDELLTHARIGYWTKSQMPLRVYVPDSTHEDGFTSFDRTEIEKDFRLWCQVVPDRLSFKMVDKPEDADIVFCQKTFPIELSYSRSVMAHTIPVMGGPEKWCVFPASKARIEPLRLNPEIKDWQDRRAPWRHTVLLHEIGHALGIIGHSASANDLMFFSGTNEISDRDKETMRRIYAPGSLLERAEKTLRQKAATDDKYALVQLAMQLDENGISSQERLAEIYRLIKRAADLGSSRAKLMLGSMYHDGNGVKRDLVLASKYFHEAASEGYPGAILALGQVYEKGDGVVQDLSVAEKYFKLALTLDLNRAPVAYGNFLAYQYGDAASQEKAAVFYKNACRNNHLEAMARLALLYEHGEGVKKDLAEAEKLKKKAHDQVMLLKVTDAGGYFARGCALSEICEPEAAVADLTAALRLKSDFRAGFLARGAAWAALGNNEAACLDMTSALKLDPDSVQGYLGRAYANIGLGKPASSLKDVNSLLASSKSPDSDRLYALIVGALSCRALHDEVGATQLLDQACGASSPKPWPGPIIRYLYHQISEADFKEALGYSRATEVCFYLAMDEVAQGRLKDAIKNLEWVKDSGDRTFYEYPAALGELERLQKSRHD